jgi:hypothetical protein
LVPRRPDLFYVALFDESSRVETAIEMLRELFPERRAAEVIERQSKPPINIVCRACSRSQNCRMGKSAAAAASSVGVPCHHLANEEDLVAKLPAKPGMNIRGKKRADEPTRLPRCLTPFTHGMALVIRNFGIVCVLCHCKGAEPEPRTKNPSAPDGRTSGSAVTYCADARYPLPPDRMRSGWDIQAMASEKDDMNLNMATRAFGRNRFCGPSTSAFGPWLPWTLDRVITKAVEEGITDQMWV